MKIHDVIIVGSGPSGIGTAIALQEMGVHDVVILERHTVGESFKRWPIETRFITPSFPSNTFLMPDLNAITPLSSPGLQFNKERISGAEYADYLNILAQNYKLTIKEGVSVIDIIPQDTIFEVKTTTTSLYAKHIVWAAGEFQYPKTDIFTGSELCRHTATIRSYADIDGEEILILGGYESGCDAAINLSRLGKKVIVIDSKDHLAVQESDPSIALAPNTVERLREEMRRGNIRIMVHADVVSVTHTNNTYKVTLASGKHLTSKTQPLLAVGFNTSTIMINHLLDRTQDGSVTLTNKDELTKTKNMYLVGPMVHHDNAIFCFIYKNRMRFAVVAAEIATRLNLDPSTVINHYKKYNMYLEDCADCASSCAC